MSAHVNEDELTRRDLLAIDFGRNAINVAFVACKKRSMSERLFGELLKEFEVNQNLYPSKQYHPHKNLIQVKIPNPIIIAIIFSFDMF